MKRRAGFSLLEVLCALLVLGVGLVGLTEGLALALRSSRESERGTQAALLAAGRMETLRAEGYLFEGEEEGEFGEDFPSYRWRQSVGRTEIEGLYEVEVAVEDAGSGEEIFTLQTLLFDMPLSSWEEPGRGSRPPALPRARGLR